MRLKEINKKEFFDFCSKQSTNNFHQSRQWAEYKRLDGWHTYFVGLDQNGKIKAAALLLSKEIPIIKKRAFYAPYGIIINYKDLELLRSFTKNIKEYLKEKKALFLKIKPYLSIQELDNLPNYKRPFLRFLSSNQYIYLYNVKDENKNKKAYGLNSKAPW